MVEEVAFEENIPDSVESYCVCCGENGTTTFLKKTIPFYKDVILAAFLCPNCGFRSSDLQSIKYEDRGIKIEISVEERIDLNREVVRTEYAKISIPELEFEIPFKEGRKGEITTIEGILLMVIESLENDQPLRKYQDHDLYVKIEAFIERFKLLLNNSQKFTFVLDDPTGNSFIQNPYAPSKDMRMKISQYIRTPSQNETIGLPPMVNVDINETLLSSSSESLSLSQKPLETHGFTSAGTKGVSIIDPNSATSFESYALKVAAPEDIVEISTPCSMCENKEGVMRMITAVVPLFKEIVLMAYTCDKCGYRNSEVKPGGLISSKGKKYVLHVNNKKDLTRDLLKSDSASLSVPEIELEITSGSLGGCFTTVEGILLKVKEQLSGRSFTGDSVEESRKNRMSSFLDKLEKLAAFEYGKFTIIIDDPLSNSYIQNLFYPEPDEGLLIEEYTRSQKQDEELGLLDMNVDHYIDDEIK